MGGATNHRIMEDAGDWMRQQEKRVMHEERRPRVTNARDIMGPGLGPNAVEIRDWGGDETDFNGFFYSRPGALGAPDSTSWWIGESIAEEAGFGIQRVWDYRGTSNPPTTRTRRFSLQGSTRVFGNWA